MVDRDDRDDRRRFVRELGLRPGRLRALHHRARLALAEAPAGVLPRNSSRSPSSSPSCSSLFIAFGSLVAWGFGRVGRWLVADADALSAALRPGDGVAGRPRHRRRRRLGRAFQRRWMLRAAQEITGRINTTMSFWLVVLVYVILGLLEVDDVRGGASPAMRQPRGRARPARGQRRDGRQVPALHADPDADERGRPACSSGRFA